MIPAIKLDISLGKPEKQIGVITSGNYCMNNKTATIYMPSIRLMFDTEQGIIESTASCIEHEVLHHCIMHISTKDTHVSLLDKWFLTKQEWIVRRMTGRHTDFLEMAPYKLADMQLHGQVMLVRRIIKFLKALWIIFLSAFWVILLLKLTGVIA